MTKTKGGPTGKCRMCGQTASLVEGHIVSAFVYRWLKRTSPTGFLRTSENANDRIQDGWKEYWFLSGV